MALKNRMEVFWIDDWIGVKVHLFDDRNRMGVCWVDDHKFIRHSCSTLRLLRWCNDPASQVTMTDREVKTHVVSTTYILYNF